jgi:hypothetical protein
MKAISLKYSLMILLAGTFSLSSCESSSDLSSGILARMVTSDNEGTTTINSDDLKSVTTGTDEITAEQIEWLKFMREEEKLAHDLYLALSTDYTTPVFTNIARAEQNHTSAVLTVLTAYGIEDPASSESGVFTNPDLQALYNTLLAQGKVTLIDALKVGALVEETDILDVADVYAGTPGDDLKTLAEALMLGSRNHLRAFNRVLKANGIVYVPVALEQTDFDAIINSSWEKGTGLCMLTGKGTGGQYLCGTGTCINPGGRGFRGGRKS